MKVIQNENTVWFDCDQTLIMHKIPLNATTITIDYYGEDRTFAVHEEHVKLLKNYSARGFFIVVWSGNGYRHAEKVVEALDLFPEVDLIMTKPNRVIDDSEPNNWAPRIYIPYE